MINIAVLGYGTVGSGVVEVIKTNQDKVNNSAGEEINVKYVLDLRDFPGDPVEEILVHDYNIILNDPDVKVICEVMGGVNPAYQFTKDALNKGKSVCTSNKELVAAHGPELLEIAKKNNANYFFEASVGGGIPIIRPLNQCITADEITEITGILNGTTNYILTKMTDEGLDFDSVLKRAQEKGYAERNPEADVEGYDACRKIAILTSLAYGKHVDYNDIYTEGITKITENDIKYAKAMNGTIKILGMSKEINGTVYSMVVPYIISTEHPLGNVHGVFNGIFVHGNMLGDTMFYGKGAGKLPTASAVVSDVIDAVKNQGNTVRTVWSEEKLELGDFADYKCCFFVRVSDKTSKENIEKTFGEVKYVEASVDSEIAFVTKQMTQKEFESKAKEIDIIYRIRTTICD